METITLYRTHDFKTNKEAFEDIKGNDEIQFFDVKADAEKFESGKSILTIKVPLTSAKVKRMPPKSGYEGDIWKVKGPLSDSSFVESYGSKKTNNGKMKLAEKIMISLKENSLIVESNEDAIKDEIQKLFAKIDANDEEDEANRNKIKKLGDDDLDSRKKKDLRDKISQNHKDNEILRDKIKKLKNKLWANVGKMVVK